MRPHMSGETSLKRILKQLRPLMDQSLYVFCAIPEGHLDHCLECSPLAIIREPEGMCMILPKNKADELRLSYDAVFKCILLQVHSSLVSVGLTAVVSTALAAAGISANIIAGLYHDQVLVPAADSARALLVLEGLSH